MGEGGAGRATEPRRRIPGRESVFSALRVRNYRLYAAGQVVSLAGTWMQRVAQDWLVLELSHDSPVALGIAAALQFGPTLALSFPGGALADRYDKRRLLMVLQTGMAACALVLGVLDVSGVATLGAVYALALLLGCFSAVDAPMRQAFAGEMVGPDRLTNAVALNSMTFNAARVVGPAVAGLLVAGLGTGWVFLLNAATFAAVLGGLALMRPAEMVVSEPVPRGDGLLATLRGGLAEVRRHREVAVVLVTVFFVSTFGINFFMTLAIVARSVFGRGAESYGLLSSALAVGCLGGTLVAARRRGRPRLREVLVPGAAFGVAEVVTGLMPTYSLVALLLVPTGLFQLVFVTAANTSVQLGVPESMRGRVMGLYVLLLLGGTPLAGPVLGWVAEAFGGRAPLWAGGAVSLLVVLAAAAAVAEAARRRRPAPA